MIKTVNLQKVFRTEEVETWALNNGRGGDLGFEQCKH